MANRIITATVTGETIRLSNKTAGAAGSFNAVSLAFTFDSAWDGTTKKVIFLNAYGENAAYTVLTTDLLVEGAYVVPIPAEPLEFAGEMSVTIRGIEMYGEVTERIIMSTSTTMKVLSALTPPVSPIEPNATQAEQLQGEIDDIKSTITNAAASATASANSATSASTSATAAQTAQTAAESARDAAVSAKTAAQTAETNAETAQTAAETARTGAQTAETNAGTYATNAGNSATAAAGSATDAQSAQTAAESARDTAVTAKTAAETARDAASSSKTAAATSESNAASSAAAASTSADNASASASAASTSASNASSSANASASSASAAASSASAADAAKTAAASSASAAATSEANAASSAQAAANSAASLVVVNDLVTGGTSNALSAEQGKVLSTSISTLSGSIVHFNLEQSLTTEQRHQARKNIGAAAEVGNMDAYELQEAVRQGRAKEILSVGDFFTVGINGANWLFQAAAFDYDVPVNPNFTHSLRLLMYPCFANVPIDAQEAIYYAPADLPAGTYWFMDNQKNKYYSFTTAKTLPAGGQIVCGWTSDSAAGYPFTSAVLYASQTSTTALETDALTQADSAPTAGTQLTPVNDGYRARWGSNNWMQSAMRQWLNSSAASGWWTPSNNYDRPQSSPTTGFLYNIDPDLLACMGQVRLRTGLNPVDNNGIYGSADNAEKVFLPSRFEVGLGFQSPVYEAPVANDGTVKTTTMPLFTDNASRIKYLGTTARSWWLRSPYPGASGAYYSYGVSPAGVLDGSFACNANAAVPACTIL